MYLGLRNSVVWVDFKALRLGEREHGLSSVLKACRVWLFWVWGSIGSLYKRFGSGVAATRS